MLTEILTVILIIAVLGALIGGNSFGESVRKGCGCIILLLILGLVLSILGI